MKTDERTEYVTRDNILKLLSDEEVARVSTAETATRLADGDEYVDLEEPDRGVQRAPGKSPAVMGHVLARRAVDETTWRRIVVLLASHQTPTSVR